MSNLPAFVPADYTKPPGETLAVELQRAGISQVELASRIDRPVKTVNDIIHARSAITPETALQLQRVLPAFSATFWLQLESNYRADLARLREAPHLVEMADWVRTFPITELRAHGLLPDTSDQAQVAEALLRFFGVTNRRSWETQWQRPLAHFLQSTKFTVSQQAVSAWLRWAETKARATPASPFNREALAELIQQTRLLTRSSVIGAFTNVRKTCLDAGVVLLLLPEFPKTRLSGATRWLSPDKVVIALTARYKRDDYLWFAFFHECAHVLLHSRRSVFIDPEDVAGSKHRHEEEANRFAMDTLIPAEELARFLSRGVIHEGAVRAFAARIGIAPSIVVGRLQHDRHIAFSKLNELHHEVDLSRLSTAN